MCRRSTVSSYEPNWPEESSRPHAPDDQGWYTLGGDGWSTSGDQGWYTSGDHARYTSGDCAWSSLGRSMTADCDEVQAESEYMSRTKMATRVLMHTSGPGYVDRAAPGAQADSAFSQKRASAPPQ